MSYSPDVVVLTLTPNNPCNTIITNSDGQELYRVTTATGDQPRTFVRDANGELIASSEWHFHKFDRITWRNDPPVSMFDWMKKSVVPFHDHLSFKDESGRRYKWKGFSPGRSLELFSEDDKFSQPIARFLKPRHILEPEPLVTDATLVLGQRAVEIQDLAVVSFLFIEKTHRSHDNIISHETWGTPLFGSMEMATARY